jgi:hypothetical protein
MFVDGGLRKRRRLTRCRVLCRVILRNAAAWCESTEVKGVLWYNTSVNEKYQGRSACQTACDSASGVVNWLSCLFEGHACHVIGAASAARKLLGQGTDGELNR